MYVDKFESNINIKTSFIHIINLERLISEPY